MTRINLIPPADLTDQHLVAEYREMTMVPAALNRTLNSSKGLVKTKISKQYTLNTGHVYFFYDKGKFLKERYDSLVQEMKDRGMNPDPDRTFPTDIFKQNNLYGNWKPNTKEININLKRINKRISQKPDWYRHTKGK